MNGVLTIKYIFTIYLTPVPCIFASYVLYFYHIMKFVKSKKVVLVANLKDSDIFQSVFIHEQFNF